MAQKQGLDLPLPGRCQLSCMAGSVPAAAAQVAEVQQRQTFQSASSQAAPTGPANTLMQPGPGVSLRGGETQPEPTQSAARSLAWHPNS